MVVANDVTRDSRVLREAGALARAGHAVTIIGVSTPRTDAPAIEERDGFTIVRLPYRAQPPFYWVPPDFFGRVRARAARRHARMVARARRILRFARRATRRLRRIGRRFVRLARILRGIPIAAWPTAVQRAVKARRRRPAMGDLETRSGGRPGGWDIIRTLGLGVIVVFVRVVNLIRDGLMLVVQLVWGSLFALANRLSGGGIEWLTSWRWRWFGWAAYVAREAPDADVWHGHDFPSLPAVVKLKRERGGIAIYDSHELYLESGHHAAKPHWAKARLSKLERSLTGEVDAVITVNRSIRDLLAPTLGRDDITVLHNCPWIDDVVHRGSRIRDGLGLAADTPFVLYHGSLAPHRGLEQLLEVITHPALRRVHLAFLGYGSLAPWLLEQSRDPAFGGRVHVLDGVHPSELLEWIAGVDVAVVPIQPSTINHINSSPNKVFEALAVGVPIAGSDFPEFRRVVLDDPDGPLGRLFDPTRPDEIALAIAALIEQPELQREALRRRCRAAAEQRWNWQLESQVLLELYRRLVADRGLPAQVEAVS